ncbi:probable ATP-dependent RNA helicase DDX59 isoform X1 [Lytechinus variegatus]|uniref:probable ATP-dependent RNA helicase DDX59 isoform X1 n=1 Tax=Lytechinus variegatus TaxID=7654 RepID=UPI001BB11C57|nr:probable ATP-dependent RNA helicase DDX59 isoform X1 [Lytechinus variegatus]XP_041465091.1 probable ATP-dependent RNA helicase DDX59 isoform X1 [Lytechinus variegatus]
MNFIPRALAKKPAKRNVPIVKKKGANLTQNASTSCQAAARVPAANFPSVEIREPPGRDDDKGTSGISLTSDQQDDGISEGSKCMNQALTVDLLPSVDDSKNPEPVQACGSPSSKGVTLRNESDEIFTENSERTPNESHKDKLQRLQELSDRISSRATVMEGHQDTMFGEALHVPHAKLSSDRAEYEETLLIQDVQHGVQEEENPESDEEPPPIVSFSKNQRWPDEDEPVCVVCGKYGEYICDQTEADVCSLECKAKNLIRRGIQPTIPQTKKPADNNTCISVQDTAAAADDVNDSPEEDDKPFIYREHPDISDLTAERVQDIRNEVQIFVEGINIHRPILEFEQLRLPAKIQSNLQVSGYVTPTPIQMQAIPSALALRDLMICAQTSSGKTLSFLVPSVITIYNQVLTRFGSKDPYVLILTPTRELAMQIEEQAKQLMKGLSSMKTALLVGGLPLPPQLHRLQQGIQFIVGTPGRIMDIINQEGVNLSDIKLVVIDEVDTMLQLGFQQQVYDIMTHLPDNHQTIFTSATIPASIEKMASSLLNNPVFISVGTPSTPCTSVKQVILWVEEPSKKKKLFAILQDPKHFRPPALVFVNSKPGADLLAQAVGKSCGISVASLHGDKPQIQRNEILQKFKDGAHDVMISTAVLGRGIDLPGVKMVVNFDMPGTVEEYIHQIGRTGRLGTSGTAMTFINNNSKKLFLQLTSLLKPLGVLLPPELINSPHLSYQRQQHRSRDRQVDASRRMPGGSGYHHTKRNRDRESVTDILKKRKRKFKP